MDMDYLPHFDREHLKEHDLLSHLAGVAHISENLANKFQSRKLGWCAGLLHDVGEFHPDFQDYLRDESQRRGSAVHSSAGTALAESGGNFYISWMIPVHHGRLPGVA